jgi:hypothetical protein
MSRPFSAKVLAAEQLNILMWFDSSHLVAIHLVTKTVARITAAAIKLASGSTFYSAELGMLTKGV